MSLQCARRLALLCWSTLLAVSGAAEAGAKGRRPAAGVLRSTVAKRRLSELTAALGHGADSGRLLRWQEALRPTYLALPKNDEGGLEHGTARYALHRFFLAHRGWRILGLESVAADGVARWNESQATSVLKEQMPTSIVELLEEHFSGGRMGLLELSVLAATLEDLIHREVVDTLQDAYRSLGHSTSEPVADEEQVYEIIDQWVTLSFQPSHHDTVSWEQIATWIDDMRHLAIYEDKAVRNPFANRSQPTYFLDFDFMAHLVEKLADGFTAFRNLDCASVKRRLLDLGEAEGRSDGRVHLPTFYSSFRESRGYLEFEGALDRQSDPSQPSVIVPNFVSGRSSCLGRDAASGLSRFARVCCPDPCVLLMEALEKQVAQPAAEAGRLAELVAQLPSDTVPAPRNLSTALRRRLEGIAAEHGGQVLLHGGSFAQFMHHAYPNECPRPRLSGQRVDTEVGWSRWQEGNHSFVVDMTVAEIDKLDTVSDDFLDPQRLDETSLRWADLDELAVDHHMPAPQRLGRRWLRDAARLLACLCAAGALLQLASQVLSQVAKGWGEPRKAECAAFTQGHLV